MWYASGASDNNGNSSLGELGAFDVTLTVTSLTECKIAIEFD